MFSRNEVSAPHNITLSMHSNIHYTPRTAHSTAFHMEDNPPTHTSNKHKGMVGKMSQDEILWCHSYLVWLVVEGSILHALAFVPETFL